MDDEKLFLALKEINEKLKGINWILMSGLAVKFYANRERKSDDIDILISNTEEFIEASLRLGKKIRNRFLEKGTFSSKDRGFEFNIAGVDGEITNGLWKMKNKDFECRPKFDKEWLKHVQERGFRGIKLKLQPLEDLIIVKIFMEREKDKKDLEHLLKLDFDKEFMKKNAENWNLYDRVSEYLGEKLD